MNDLPGEYRIGYFRSTANGTDLYKDDNRQPAALTGNDYRSVSSRHGYWWLGKQQVTSVDGDPSRGLTLTTSLSFYDRSTTPVASYQKLSALYKGPFDVRPKDALGCCDGWLNAYAAQSLGSSRAALTSPSSQS